MGCCSTCVDRTQLGCDRSLISRFPPKTAKMESSHTELTLSLNLPGCQTRKKSVCTGVLFSREDVLGRFENVCECFWPFPKKDLLWVVHPFSACFGSILTRMGQQFHPLIHTVCKNTGHAHGERRNQHICQCLSTLMYVEHTM